MKQQSQIAVPFESTVGVICESCEGEVFQEGFLLRKVSKVLIASDKDQYMPIPVMVCVKCDHVNQEFLPKQQVA